MKSLFVRALSVFTTVSLLGTSFVSCSTDNENETVDPSKNNVNDLVSTDVAAGAELQETELPVPTLSFDKQDYGGISFHILTCSEADYEYLAEEMTGERVNDAIFERNRNTEEYLNIVLDVIYESGDWGAKDSYNAIITNSITAGDNAFDYVTGMISCIQPLASTELFLNLNEMPGMDLSNPWWVSSMQKELSLNGKLLSVIGDVSLSLYKGLSVYFFNQNLITERNLDNPFDLVRNGEWTVDNMIRLTADTGEDLNGDGVWKEGEDLYGNMIFELVYRSMNAALDVHPVHIGEDGIPVVGNLDERTINVIEKLTDYLHQNPSVWIKQDNIVPLNCFKSGYTIFFLSKLQDMETMGDMEANYGIIPMPKYDENQDAYYTQIATGTQIILVPVTIGSKDITGHVLETLCFLTWRDVVNEYYENSLQSRYSRDSDTAEMLDIIRQGAVNGFDYAYSTSIGGTPWVNKIVSDFSWLEQPAASSYETQKQVWQSNIDKILENYQ